MTDDIAALKQENERLRREIEELRAEIEELRLDADLDAAHAAGLSAQLRAIIAEGDACPNKAAHSLLERAQYTNDRTGEPMTKTRSYPLYRQAFDEECREAGIEDPERHRA